MRKYIIITTVQEPTEAVKKFAHLAHWKLIVVGDKKTPAGWQCDGAIYLPPAAQKKYKIRLPYNHYARKMYGYLYAIKDGATHIAESDDDNIPYEGWGFPAHEGEFAVYDRTNYDAAGGVPFVNIYRYFAKQHIWPRGLPLSWVRFVPPPIVSATPGARIGIWQGLADNDPDVDAIYRLTLGAPCIFEKRAPVVLEKGTACPFNSQNTFFKKELFPLLYLPVTVNQRFSDILRGYVAQPVMWAAGWHLGFTQASVTQRRNQHDLLADLVDEVPCYTLASEAFYIASASVRPEDTIAKNMRRAYAALAAAGILQKEELKYLSAWFDALEAAR